jgi:hypothetical protein
VYSALKAEKQFRPKKNPCFRAFGKEKWAMRDSNNLPRHGENKQTEGSGGAYGDHHYPSLAELFRIAERLPADAIADLVAVARGLERASAR